LTMKTKRTFRSTWEMRNAAKGKHSQGKRMTSTFSRWCNIHQCRGTYQLLLRAVRMLMMSRRESFPFSAIAPTGTIKPALSTL
jgi:hypothetical protein